MKKKLIYGILITTIVAFVAWGPIVSNNAEKPKYTIIELDDNIINDDIEIREYAPMIIAEVTIVGKRKESIGEGFRLIGDYIFGNNTLNEPVEMTAPVIQQRGEEIPMTAPVIQQQNTGNKSWKVGFIMPSKHTMQTLPKPNNNAITLKETPSRRYAVIGFSGTGSKENLEENTKVLKAYMAVKNMKAISEPIFAFFNPPWTLPFFRHNEVMIEIKK